MGTAARPALLTPRLGRRYGTLVPTGPERHDAALPDAPAHPLRGRLQLPAEPAHALAGRSATVERYHALYCR